MLAHTKAIVLISICGLALSAQATQFDTKVPMSKKGTTTYYVPVHFEGAPNNDLMVDTGSDYVTINETTLQHLKDQGMVDYVRDVGGVMADGRDVVVPIYRIANLNIGCCCMVKDVEAAVFSGTERQILGLSALRKVAPFALSVEPAHLILSDCNVHPQELAKS